MTVRKQSVGLSMMRGRSVVVDVNGAGADASAASVEPVMWEVRPAGIQNTKFDDPESFYLTIRRSQWQEQPTFVVSRLNRSTAFTRNGVEVFLRHDVNAKHAHHESFEEAVALARALADGTLASVGYRTWQAAEARHWPEASTTG